MTALPKILWFSLSGILSRTSGNVNNNFLIFDKGPNNDIKDQVGESEKRPSINFTKSRT